MRDAKILQKMATEGYLLLARKNVLLTVVFSTNNPGMSKHCSVAKYGLISRQCLLLHGVESVPTGLRINSRDGTEVKALVF